MIKKKKYLNSSQNNNIPTNNNNSNQMVFLPHPILIKILAYAHGGIFPSVTFKSCLMVCKNWKQNITPKSFSKLIFHQCSESKRAYLMRTFLLSQEFNETLSEIEVNSLTEIDGCLKILGSLTTPFFCKFTSTLYHPPLNRLTITGVELKDREIDLVTDLIRIYNITSLTLKGVQLNDTYLISICKSLKDQHYNTLRYLNLSHNQFSKKSLEMLFETLIETLNTNHQDNLLTNSRKYFYHHLNINSDQQNSEKEGDKRQSIQSNQTIVSNSTQSNKTVSPLVHQQLVDHQHVLQARKLLHKNKQKESLHTLDLSNNQKLNLECINLMKKVLVGLDSLNDINLSGISLCSEALASFIAFIKATPSIRSINLSNNGIYGKGVEGISQLLLDNKIESLDISENKISTEGIKSLFQAISTLNNSINNNKNSINNNNNLPSNKNIIAGSHLKHLYLRRTMLSFEESLILRNLIFQSQSLETLDFSSNQINKESISVLSEPLTFNRSITDLNLSFNILGPSGVEELSKIIKSNKTIQTLHLHCVSMKKEGVAHLVDALYHNHTISTLYISNNEIRNLGCLLFSKLFQKNQSLLYVDFSYNAIKDKGVNELLKSVNEYHQHLKYDLGGNQFKNKDSCKIM
ncbi:hypothetical protein DLAC_00557 [Tieghemostelium lacteum]|uniref:Leucine-rich repeat-containing protein (LRR) n=1 Tax=Tieghemostelium lacteum TaxID=361077 RepID=A0A152AAA4_TIELA|nr:hypothetical protein DLAC_00557 [Tieghemostelium lacteum]|eukprot:KYR03065.1 hypothetical protein DLAC_00557 [Tieghemostelium lacteum]